MGEVEIDGKTATCIREEEGVIDEIDVAATESMTPS
jgi:hypothetical protein